VHAAAILLILFVSHLLGAVAAYGGALLALPMLVWVMDDVHVAVVVLMLLGGLQAFQILLYTWRDIDWQEAKWFVGVPLLALPAGVLTAAWLPRRALVALLGGLLLASGGWRLLALVREARQALPSDAPEPSPPPDAAAAAPPRLPGLARAALLVLGGVVHGAFACGGATLVVYAQHTFGRKAPFRATLALLWVTLNIFLFGALLAQGRLEREPLTIVAIAVPVVLAAGWLGQRVAARLPERHFAGLVAVLLVASGCITLARVAA
jgi:uncharacterized membrane protein YfcA